METLKNNGLWVCEELCENRISFGSRPDVDDSQDLMRQELEKYEQLNKVDKGRFVFDFKIINPE